MAVGIDKLLHARLINGLQALSCEDKTSYWLSLMNELEQVYEETGKLQRLAEVTAGLYNDLQAKVRCQVANEQRNRKRKRRSKPY